MRDPKRIERIIKDIETIWKTQPDVRLCQWLTILASVYGNWKLNDLFSFEDSDLEIAIQKYKKLKGITDDGFKNR